MTKREAAIVSAYTGFLIGEFSDFQAYVEEIMGRPIFTHGFPHIIESTIYILGRSMYKTELKERRSK